jgi:hypothetical protein
MVRMKTEPVGGGELLQAPYFLRFTLWHNASENNE